MPLAIWGFFEKLFGLGDKVYDDVKEKRETDRRDDNESDIKKGRLDVARKRLYRFLRKPRGS